LDPTKRRKGEKIMENQFNGNQFREDEIVIMSHWDKKNEEWVRTVYPKIGGRLRLAHEDNDNLSITTEIIKYDENIAVVRAVSTTTKGSFPGIGMSSTERDEKIAPAILELAESRAIARSLRFAGRRGKGDVDSIATYESRNTFHAVQHSIFHFASWVSKQDDKGFPQSVLPLG
jgi:hypothetical protein